MFGVQPFFAASAVRRFLRDLQAGLFKPGKHFRFPLATQFARVNGDTFGDQLLFQRVGLEQFGGEAPQGVNRLLHFLRRNVGAVAQTLQPATAKAQVIACFFDRFRGNCRNLRIAALGQTGKERHVPGVDEILTHQGVGEVAVRLFHQQQVAELALVAAKGQRVFVAAAFEFGGVG
ncbi:hypothetical protein D3C71_1450920 [compost metagenome]